MEHDQLPEHTTQRYILDEMTEAERNEFEEHYFDCTICAADLKDTARLMVVAREITREKLPVRPVQIAEIHPFQPRRPWERWYPRLASAAAAVFAVVIVLQAIDPPDETPRRGGVATRYEVTTSQTRGVPAAASLESVRVDEIASVDVEILPPAEEVTGYVISIRDAAGRVQQSSNIGLEQAEEPVPVVLPALPRGRYEMVIEGVRKSDGNRFEITRQTFEVV